ncbi:SDR family oxidoreductase [Aeromicrobium senzhongii]|uniref:SDR family oxidoreductase n=1 Tax=Aeromicrobium senzhongii TaxID=2663859 RepID=A0ABX6SY63_9ACTN|nr:NAD(P)-binding oxidoreductase [Aeromicrobium senzhongii]MTB87596.1 NAD(P)H-binding protein [Aeromicrobium senzhongii]QNL95364.1 SDR family oxidoreductase [Aeromicrobium senzhongii]
MKITIIGGSQGTGAELARLASAAGHEVTVLSRSGSAPAGARSITGSATDPASAAAAVTGADAVVVTVGGAKGVRHQRAAVTAEIVTAMEQAGVRRLVVQSSLGAGDSARQLPGVLRWITPLLLASPLADHNAQEAAVMSSGLDWTIVRPTGLTRKPSTGAWTALEVGQPGTLRGTITRADLAAYLLQVVQDPSTIGAAIGISNS